MKSCYASSGTPSCTVNESLLFLHIPKNAGTTIENVALQQGVRWGSHMDFDGCGVGLGRCYARWHEPPAFTEAIVARLCSTSKRLSPNSFSSLSSNWRWVSNEMHSAPATGAPDDKAPSNIYGDATVFCVVRNPFDRVISEYKYIYDNPEYRWSNADLLDEYGCDPAGLNAWVVRMLKDYVAGNTFAQLCHLLPQSYYIWGPPDAAGRQCQYCHEILRMEELPGSFNALMQSYNYSMRLGSEQHNAGGCPNLGVHSLNRPAIELILQVYERDFALLKYSTDAGQGG